VSGRPAAWIIAGLAVAVALPMLLPFGGGAALVLAVPFAVAGSILLGRRGSGHDDRDAADRLVAAVATLTGGPTPSDGEGDERVDWGAAMRAELATITVPRERWRFAVGAAVALLGRPRSGRSFVVALGVAVAAGGGLSGVSRAGLGDNGLASVTLFVPPVLLFALAYLCARSARSLRFGLETGLVAALTTLVAVAVVYGIEAVHWYHLAPDVSVLDGDYVELDSTRAAVLDTIHPVLLAVHLVFWSPFAVLGAAFGARALRATG
jgi:hypothetical protein